MQTQFDTWSARIFKTAAEAQQLNTTARHLLQQDVPMLDLDFFLASISKGWRPRIVAVYRAGEVVGICYAKERVISNTVPTGVVYADGALGGFLLANPLHRQNAIRTALQTLWAAPGTHGLRLRILQGSAEAAGASKVIDSISAYVRCTPIQPVLTPDLWRHHAHLALPSTYSKFLEQLGYTTRHNFRYYRKRFEATGHRFVTGLSVADLRAATSELMAKSKFYTEARRVNLEDALRLIGAAKRPLVVGLQSRKGEWMSVIGGWYRPGGAVLMYQCNDDLEFNRDSLSTVLRSYLIEQLIDEKQQELVIWTGTRGPLMRYVTYPPALAVSLDLKSHLWRAARRAAFTFGPHLPRRWADVVMGYFDTCP